ncbi:Uncharacterized protein conserved in bacteria [Rhodococcus rhodochrous]|uniref:nucleotidyltransferase family protein n=1 Tax=Rhodococcus rhodochrous TaxID=1829 RepID=UPI0009B999B9|nr:nucleotidyltransferase family protein [Rhodococcus rhodochrous]MDO1485540.1 hypothetical protein [Rhodococcus rhodochrous]SNV19145.1 Uncharacterized protein conserved in bacteria [Rhodococcus rhodochrous]
MVGLEVAVASGVDDLFYFDDADLSYAAIDHFASTTCCFGIARDPGSGLRVFAPHGFDDLFGMVLRPNPVLAPREVYEAKARRWQAERPRSIVVPWPEG